MSDPTNFQVEIDYNANIYFRHTSLNIYYIVCFDMDTENGIVLERMTPASIHASRELAQDYAYFEKHMKRGKIILSDMTLKGRVTQVLEGMDNEEFDNVAEQHQFTTYDSTFKENDFFRIEQIKKSVDTDDDLQDSDDSQDSQDSDDSDWGEDDDPEEDYIFSGVSSGDKSYGIILSSLLCDSMAYNDTLMIRGGIDSKVITSCIQRADSYCTQRLIIYSNGFVKVQYPGTKSILCQIVCDKEGIALRHIEKINES